jgi:hypothetical protein
MSAAERTKVLYNGKNSKVFLSSLKIVLGLAKVYKSTNFSGNEKFTPTQHTSYLENLRLDITAGTDEEKAAAIQTFADYDRALLIIQNNIEPEILPSYERYDAFQFLQMLHNLCTNQSYLNQSLEVEQLLDSVKDKYSDDSDLSGLLMSYQAIYSTALAHGNGLSNNLGAKLLFHCQKISEFLKTQLNIWKATISGDSDSFAFTKVHDKALEELKSLGTSFDSSAAAYVAVCKWHEYSKSHSSEDCSLNPKNINGAPRSDFYTRGRGGARGAVYRGRGGRGGRGGGRDRYRSDTRDKEHRWCKSKNERKPWSKDNPSGFMTQALVASSIKEALSSYASHKDKTEEISDLQQRLTRLASATDATATFVARVSEEDCSTVAIPEIWEVPDYEESDDYDFSYIASTFFAGQNATMKVVLDCASTHNLVGNVAILSPSSLQDSTSLPITGLSSSPYQPEKMGTLNLTTVAGNKFSVSKCHVVPTLGNIALISLGALTHYGVAVLFKDADAVAYHDSKVLFSASRGKNNLYHIDLDSKVSESCLSYYSVTDTTIIGSSTPRQLKNNKLDSILHSPSINNSIYASYIISNITNPRLKIKEFIPASQTHIPLTRKRSLFEWHCALGHASSDRIKAFAKESALHGITFSNLSRFDCESCLKAHSKQPSRPKTRNTRATQPGQFLHADLSFNEQVASFPDKFKKFCVYVDDASNMYFIVFINKKSEVHKKFEKFATWLQGFTQVKLERLQVDGGTEFKGEISKFIAENSVEVQISMPNNQWQNARAERATDIIWRGATALLSHANLPEALWPDAVKVFVSSRNMLPSNGSINPRISCFQIFTRRIPNLSHTRVFGQVAWFHVSKQDRVIKTKTSSRALKGIFIGYPDKMKGYIILDPLTMVRHNVPIHTGIPWS